MRVPGWQTRRRNESEGSAFFGLLWREPSSPERGRIVDRSRASRCGGI